MSEENVFDKIRRLYTEEAHAEIERLTAINAELLEVCRDCEGLLKKQMEDIEGGLLNRVRAAISKATGGDS